MYFISCRLLFFQYDYFVLMYLSKTDPTRTNLNVCKLKNIKFKTQKFENEAHIETFLANVYFSAIQKLQTSFEICSSLKDLNSGELSFHSVFADNSNKKHFVRPPFSPLIDTKNFGFIPTTSVMKVFYVQSLRLNVYTYHLEIANY